MAGSATEGERTAVKISAETMARCTGMALQQAISASQEIEAQASKGFLEGFDD